MCPAQGIPRLGINFGYVYVLLARPRPMIRAAFWLFELIALEVLCAGHAELAIVLHLLAVQEESLFDGCGILVTFVSIDRRRDGADGVRLGDMPRIERRRTLCPRSSLSRGQPVHSRPSRMKRNVSRGSPPVLRSRDSR